MTEPGAAVSPDTPRPLGPILRQLTPSVFLPAMIYEIGNGAIAPIVALTAVGLGASPALAALVVGFLGIGRVLGDIPASWLAERIGDRRAMVVAASLETVALLGCFFSPSIALFALALLISGMATATFYLARQSYLADVVAVAHRARAMSTLGGSHRIGLFIGPFIGALFVGTFGLSSAYLVAIGATIAAAVLLLSIADLEPPSHTAAVRADKSTRAVLFEHRLVFSTLGATMIGCGAVLAARQTVVPLWAEHLGIGPAETSLIFGTAGAVEIVLFYPAGKVADRFGRLAVALPWMIVLGAAIVAVPFTVGPLSLTVVAIVMSIGSGIGAGTIMTLGADVAPLIGRLRFIGIWRVLSDSGFAAGPAVLSLIAVTTSLAAGIVVIGSVGLGAAVALRVFVPRHTDTRPSQPPRTPRPPQPRPPQPPPELLD
ncbi:MFS transporter [Subtercola endophyticus]|uniref:MFS transporter n=1 Tax=Subtercola endophyticus TaxID=2895559 RepID=UPI001E59B9F0|nr:MFS transporter [Subtercola endophyticus]UFS58316.1 MFS transporter [Subtercola endophyticus]